ncbi:MAG: M15 family metallopeptidase [Clostridiales bacterium]|nr:M15 family metallopeptidase [Clostridiales bacterium]
MEVYEADETLVQIISGEVDSLESPFHIEELSQEIIDRISGKSYKDDTDIPYSDLRYIRLLHIGFDGLAHEGEMIVNKAIADDVVDFFKELYKIEYPIEKILLIDDYDADDLKSMADNNSSAFNYRLVEGTTRRSIHSDGLAIDINPLYNPYVRTRDGKLEILPENASDYVDRDKDNNYYIRKNDPIYKAFVSRGFTWGGEWKNSKDYQHFEKKERIDK